MNTAGFNIRLLATGGTIEKHYDPHSGQLTLNAPVLEALLDELVHPDVAIAVERLMAIDSLDMQPEHRQQIVDAVADRSCDEAVDAIVITHGTDTLADTASALAQAMPAPRVPVVLTGAMVPYRMAASDASQNVAQALMAARLLAPGVYAAFHGRVIDGARVAKDYTRLTLVEDGGRG